MRQLINEYLGMVEPDNVEAEKYGTLHNYTFHHAGKKVKVYARHKSDTADIGFAVDRMTDSEMAEKVDPKVAAGIYSRVLHQISQHADKHNLNTLYFMGVNERQNKLYKKMGEHMAQKYGWTMTSIIYSPKTEEHMLTRNKA